MASTLKKMTGMGGDVRKIAALLQKKAPAGHKLAYINDEEAALLKARGGSGKPHADTGIPSYEVEDTSYGGYDIQGGQDYIPETTTVTEPVISAEPYTGGGITLGGGYTGVQPGGYSGLQATQAQMPQPEISVPTSPLYSADTSRAFAETLTPARPEAGGKKDEGISKELLTRLGLAGGLGLIGASTARKAAAQGRAGAQEIQNLAAPYQKQGAELQAQAQRGELTPAAQQSLQAARAQATQSAEGRGGVGATQIEAQIQAFRQQLLAQQYDYGLKLSGIGDNIALGAIKSGLEADRYVNQLNNSFYTNMAYIASGSRPNVVISGGNT